MRYKIMSQVKWQVFLEEVDHVKAQDLAKEVLGALVLAILISLPGTLKEESFPEGRGECLNIIVTLIHPDVVEFLLLLHDFSLKNLAKILDHKRLLHENQVPHGLEVEHVSFGQLLES